jgi:hypothetical protein
MSQLNSSHEKPIIHSIFVFLSLFIFFIFIAAPQAFIETLREKMFKPSLSTIVNENTKYVLTLELMYLKIYLI